MNKMLSLLFALLVVSPGALAAPYYTGLGCNEEGTRCTFGTPSGRVLNWSKKGTIEELGPRCEHFINNIEARKNIIAQSQDVELQYRNFTYGYSTELDKNGHAKIVCNVELHSELKDVKIEGRLVKSLNWVCSSKKSGGPCAHYLKECESLRDQALRDSSVLDATIYFGGSLLQGNTCDVVTAKFK